ncbi:hypothetical protein [Paenibacillus sp. HW567]|uniref:hypothetical protein n=1 Tax=Paenibacillus sp. HW567 TaxID=1034769 RepID=UPI0018DB9FAB|nr:hypothetical protein [Paenibacillus sp. HW567]
MLKISVEKLCLQEEITIDPYIPIDIKWGTWNEAEEGTHYFRLGDFKKSLLEIGVGSNTGLIRSITLVDSNKVVLDSVGKVNNLTNNEQGILVFDLTQMKEKGTLDVECKLEVYMFSNNLLLSFRDGEVAKCIHSGKVIFGVNELDELCFIKVGGLSNEETIQLNDSLSFMV